ncbi:MAG TPA: hypothetical protein VJ957_06580, partial [Longimicrobiales bacterium]|nr:hypothetical protein [Longimicrobiales bacterium]
MPIGGRRSAIVGRGRQGRFFASLLAAALAPWGALAPVPGLLAPAPAAAQETALTSRCAAISVDADQRFCNLVAQSVVVLQPRLGIAAAGGNPVAGTASTVGMRMGATPRLSLTLRTGGILVEGPGILDRTTGGTVRFLAAGLGVDAAMGLLEGLSLAPTVGGVLSVDALAGATLMPLAGNFQQAVNLSWALGGRVGLLRESFTLPGVSVSLMYRHFGHVTFGDPGLVGSDGFFQSNLSMLSLRGAASKRIFLFDVS